MPAVLAQPLRFHQFGGFLIGEVHLPRFFDEASSSSRSSVISLKVMNGAPTCLAISTKSFHASGLSSSFPHDRGNVLRDVAGQTDETVAFNEGHHSSFSDSRLSVLIVKQSFSQMRAGSGGDHMWKPCSHRAVLPSSACNLVAGGYRLPPFSSTTSLSAITSALKVLRGPRAPPMARANCTRSCSSLTKAAGLGNASASTSLAALTSANTGRRWWFIPEAVWYGHVQARRCGGDCAGAPDQRAAGGAAAPGR